MSFLDGRTFGAVIFDLDGTLVDSNAALISAWTAWAIRYGVTEEQLAGYQGTPTADIVAEVLAADLQAEALTHIDELESVTVDGIVPIPGAAAALAALAGVPVAIATSGSRPVAEARLRAAGITAPEVLITFDDVDRGKPAPDPFLLAAERLGVAAADCLVVEDALRGLTAARAAGCATLGLLTTTPRDVLATADLADALVADLSAITWHALDGRVSLTVTSPPDQPVG